MQLLHDRTSFHLMTYLAAKTTTLRLGTALTLPWHTGFVDGWRHWILRRRRRIATTNLRLGMVDDDHPGRLEVIRQGGIEYVLLSNAGGGAAGLRQFSEAFI